MEVRYHRPIHTSDDHIVLRARVEEQRRNLVRIAVRITDSQERLCTEATCVYFLFPKEKARTEFHFCDCSTEEGDFDPLSAAGHPETAGE